MQKQKLIVGITGASGVVYGVHLLKALKEIQAIESHLVLTHGAVETLAHETDFTASEITELADQVWDEGNMAASISSGSFSAMGMVVLPCSMKSLSAIAHSYDNNLIARAASVQLKEGRKLVLCPRETPLHLGYLKNMTAACEMGAVILPPLPAFYHKPTTIEELINQTVGKVLDQFGIEHQLFQRWGNQ